MSPGAVHRELKQQRDIREKKRQAELDRRVRSRADAMQSKFMREIIEDYQYDRVYIYDEDDSMEYDGTFHRSEELCVVLWNDGSRTARRVRE